MISKIRHVFGFTRQSYALLSIFMLTCLLIIYIWWPLVEEYLAYMDGGFPWYYYVDWLLLGIFTFMSLSIMARADLKTDGLIIFVGLCGGLAIESWGTQTNLWHYYTAERPPLWIIPAWPIASLSIDRITRSLEHISNRFLEAQGSESNLKVIGKSIYWFVFGGFYILMLWFIAPTLGKSYTIAALVICALMILTPPDMRKAFLVFAAGSGLGYFLERWGTTRECWVYYTNQTPPLFAVLAHGMAAVAFWRTGILIQSVWEKVKSLLSSSYRDHSTE
ncbi:MAG: hypothetical protein NTW32_07110 [Chloroflexi bacterium]|nr:hypothetical protein [Chloroflexota bacterium]